MTITSGLTESSTLQELLEEIKISSNARRKLEKLFDSGISLREIISQTGDEMQKKMNDETYMNICEIFMEFISTPEQYPFFSRYIPTTLAMMNDHENYSGEFARKVALPKNIQEHIPEKPLFSLLKSLHTIRQLYYADIGSSTVNKNFFVITAKMYIKEYYEK